MDRVCRRLKIFGVVQGVGYRNTLEHRARKLGITGWVRNRGDGTVEAVVCGSSEQIKAVIDWAWRGPPLARVEKIEIENAAPDEFAGFTRLPTL